MNVYGGAMSLVKVPSKALQKLMVPVHYHNVQPDITFSPGKGGIAARLHKYSLYRDLSHYDAGFKVLVSRLARRCLYLSANAPLELKASYELTMQGYKTLAGYLTPLDRESGKSSLYCYQFHTNTWLTEEQLMRLAVDFDQ